MKLLMAEWYSPDDANDGERYKLRGLTGIEAIPVINFFRGEAAKARQAGRDFKPADIEVPPEIMKSVITAGLEDWTGVFDGDDNPLAFDKSLAVCLPFDRLNELVAVILDRSQLSKEQEKNSQSPSKSKRTKKTSIA